jgi:hypothetical protein
MSNSQPRERVKGAAKTALRYPWAAALIPVGLALGAGGLLQHAVRTVRGRPRDRRREL